MPGLHLATLPNKQQFFVDSSKKLGLSLNSLRVTGLNKAQEASETDVVVGVLSTMVWMTSRT